MKRAPIVLTGTACGLVAVIGYHTAAPQASALTAGSSGSSTASSLSVGGTSSSSGTTATTARSSTTATTATTANAGAGAAGPVTTRSATGSDVGYPFGDLEVKVTMTGSRITDVAVVRHNTYDPRSAMIDQYAMPLLRSQALTAQSAHIDGISGASYTSAAYAQSLQSAIDKLKA